MPDHFQEKISAHLPYLEDLRRRLYRGVVLFSISFIGGFLSAGPLLKYLMRFIDMTQVTLAASSPFQFADLAMDTGFFVALIITIPYIIYSLYAFFIPALSRNEKRVLFRSVPACIGLFAAGFSYGFYVLYYALQLMADINIDIGLKNIWNISDFMSQMFLTATLLGLVFEFPLILSIFIRLGLFDVRFLRKKRRIAYFMVFCLVSLLPPTDGLSLMVMSLPLVVLYEVTILFNRNNINYHVWTRN